MLWLARNTKPGDPTTQLKGIDSLPISSSERARVCQIQVTHPVYGCALNTNHCHIGVAQKSPFAITRAPGANGGKIGGKISFFRAVSSVLEPSKNVFWLA